MKLLIVEDQSGTLETLEEAVVREINEETGLIITAQSEDFYKIKLLDENTNLEQVHTYGKGNDVRGGMTTVYAVQLHFDPNIIQKNFLNIRNM